MTFPRKIGVLLILTAVLATVGEFFGLSLPSLRWFYSFDGGIEWLAELGMSSDEQARAIGIGFSVVLAGVGLGLLIGGGGYQWNPLTLRKLERFRSIGRGYMSYKLLVVLVVLALLDQAVVGKRALAVKYEGAWSFPAFQDRIYEEEDFGGIGEQEVDFRKLKQRFDEEKSDAVVILPPVPWDPTFDSDEVLKRGLPMIEGKIFTTNGREPYSGRAERFREDDPEQRVRSVSIRDGVENGPGEVYNEQGEFIGRETWRRGELIESTVRDDFEVPELGGWVEMIYPPAPPSWNQKHFLGTDSKGWDILAQLYGGMQVVFKASILYLLLTYVIGIAIGCMMGYFGGAFDMVMHRVMEILSNVPFLLVVMIITNNIGRDNITLTTILVVFCIFSWIGVAIYLRTATYKEKARDYASAARVLGAGTGRVIFRHILPNAISTIVTLVPFSVSSVVASLTALDFLGFGVPDSYPSWGRILNDGVSNLSSPWIVTSVFAMMVFLLLLITFVGEAIREAFDPRKFTTYQ